MKFPGFVGGSYTLSSVRADAQSAVNLYVEKDESAEGKSPAQLVGSPGLAVFCTLPTVPVRGIWIGEDRMFVVSGSKLYEVNSSGTIINGIGGNPDRGDVGNDGKPAQIFPNGTQLAIVSNGLLWVDGGGGVTQPQYSGLAGVVDITNVFGAFGLAKWVSGDKFDNSVVGKTLTTGAGSGTIQAVLTPTLVQFTYGGGTVNGTNYSIPSGVVHASSGTLLDGYAIISIPSSAQINISGNFNFAAWNRIDYAVKEGYPDHIVSVIASHEELYLIGKQTIEIWQNTRNPDFPYERIPGAVLQLGSAAAFAVDKLSDGIALLGADTRGGPIAYYIAGRQRRRISTHAVELAWKGYSVTSDAVSYSYIDSGHHFWVVSFPTANATWVYDLTEDDWTQRGWWNGSSLDRQRGYVHGFVWGKHYVGDWQTGVIYEMASKYEDDAGTAILRQRAAPHISDDNKRSFFSEFTLDIQMGETLAPAFTLDWSTDGGINWSTGRTINGGPIGNGKWRMIWRRLGSSRDRVFRVTSLAPMLHTWIAAYIEFEKGN